MIQPKADFTLYMHASIEEGKDYEETKTMLEFEAEQSTSCVAITILDDCVLEELESFKIEINKEDIYPDDDRRSRVKVDAGEGEVRITDEQSKYPQPLLPTQQSHQLTFAFLV